MSTNILDIDNLDIDNLDITDTKNPLEIIYDLSIQEDIRLGVLRNYEGDTLEIILRLCSMYRVSGIKVLKSFLEKIVLDKDINIVYKLECAKALDDPRMYNIICSVSTTDLPSPCRIECIIMLMESDGGAYTDKALSYLKTFVVDDSIECDFRYRSILSLEKVKKEWDESDVDEDERPPWDFYIRETQHTFLLHDPNDIYYRILSAQYILRHYRNPMTIELRESAQILLVHFSQDTDTPYNLRADAADVLMRLGDGDFTLLGRDTIEDLGRDPVEGDHTVFGNAQNVHTEEVESSVAQALEFFTENVRVKQHVTFEYIKKEILKDKDENKVNEEQDENSPLNRVKLSLNRIDMDRVLYSKYNSTLSSILIWVWSYIEGHEHEGTLRERLWEELVDMSGTCSSGFASRLINTLSGFGDLTVGISWEDQIIANFSGRLNSAARNITEKDFTYLGDVRSLLKDDDMTDEDLVVEFQSRVLEEMTKITYDYSNHSHFSLFLRKNLPGIKEEMYQEFTSHLDDTTFDLYMRKAIMHYEGF